jgi:hypothetical protein
VAEVPFAAPVLVQDTSKKALSPAISFAFCDVWFPKVMYFISFARNCLARVFGPVICRFHPDEEGVCQAKIAGRFTPFGYAMSFGTATARQMRNIL